MTDIENSLEIIRRSWKQPLAVDLYKVLGRDLVLTMLMSEFVRRAKNSDEKEFKRGDRTDLLFLRRGQCVVGEEELAQAFHRSRNFIRNRLENLAVLYNLIDIQKTPKGTVVTIKNYDAFIRMDSQTDNQRTSKGQPKDTNKSGKSVKKKKNFSSFAQDGEISSSKVGTTALLWELANRASDKRRAILERRPTL